MTEDHQPANLTEKIKNKIINVSKKILEVLGIECGMAHLELKIVDEEIYFIEVGARAGGDHIADTLTLLSTDYDYYRGAIECSFNMLRPPTVHNIAHSGIIFHCYENMKLKKIFDIADGSDWCIKNTVKENYFKNAIGNMEAVDAGYIIYCSDHRIDQSDSAENYQVKLVNNEKDAFSLIWNHNKEIGRTLSDEELRKGIEKFIKCGCPIAIIENNKIIAFLMLYCNNISTLEAYICNVYVIDSYRGKGLSNLLLEKAINICEQKNFVKIKLHVAENNIVAIQLYKKYGFHFNGIVKESNVNEKQLEMVKVLNI